MDAVFAYQDADGHLPLKVCYDFGDPLFLYMAVKIAAFVLTLLINIGIGFALFFVMLVAMNGYSESDATYGLVSFAILGIIVSFLMATLAAFAAGKLIKRELNPILSVLIAVIVFSLFGAFLKVVCSIIGVGISEFVRVNF